MIEFILIFLSLVTILLVVIFSVVILFHFKRFGLADDPDTKKILRIFTTGTLVLIGLNIFFLYLNF